MRTFAGWVALLVAVLLTGCTATRPPVDDATLPRPHAGTSEESSPGPGEYLPGLEASVDLPAGDPRAVVVLVPGGGWSSADPTGLRLLVGPLTEADLAVVTITYGTSATEDFYPRPADDVACAVAYAGEQVPDVPVVLVGHSAGAHLAALVALRGGTDPECPYPAREADGVVGLAGPYDVSQAGGIAGRHLFGTRESEDADRWADGNPHTWVGERPELPFLLVHGDADAEVPMFFTDDLAVALDEAGHPVTVEVLPEVTHLTIILPGVIGDVLVGWVARAVVAEAPAPV